MASSLIHVTKKSANPPWRIKIDGSFKQHVENEILKDDSITQDAVDTIFQNATRILSKCPDPSSKERVSRTGIIIGKVQSGKTSNFISVLALAFDNGYDLAIVLGGNTLDLLKQNASRIEHSFNVDNEKLLVLTTNHNKSLIEPALIKEFVENGRKVIIVGLKHNKHITLISDIFSNEYLSRKPILIIDDEGDQATLNTLAYKKSVSTTYKSVLALKDRLHTHCFLSVTATPQANILIETFDHLSPDFGELVYPGEGYCGLQEFHGENEDKQIIEIPSSEKNLLDDTGVPKSLLEALAMFFVGNAIRYSRGDFRNHAMLIHPSQKKADHKIAITKVQNILDNWKTKAKMILDGCRDISYNSLRHRLLAAYDIFVNAGVICKTFQEIEPSILKIIKLCSPVHMCNSDENASENARLFKTNIFVGGNLVERGITIKGLAITYITRRAKGKANVDNTEQRARWFGYKQDYLDVCRVFATKDIKDDFSSILEHDEDMWASIERARDRGIAFKDMPRIFKLARSTFLQLTRANVAKTESYQLAEWKPQKYLVLDQSISNENCKVISDFRSTHQGKIRLEQHTSTQIHAILEDISYNNVYNELLSKLQFHPSEIVSISFFLKLYEAMKKLGLNPFVDVLWLRDKRETTRKINEDETIQQFFQGRNPNLQSAEYYKGDRSLVDSKPNNIQIQIQHIKPSNHPHIDFSSPAIAIYIPDNYSTELSRLVVKKDG